MKSFLASLFALAFIALALIAFAGCMNDDGLPPLVDSYPEITSASHQAYKAALEDRNLRGYAMIRVEIAADGSVARAAPEGGSSAVMAVLLPLASSWKFKPAMKDGHPLPFTFVIRAGVDDPAAPPDRVTAWRAKLQSDPWAGPYLKIKQDRHAQLAERGSAGPILDSSGRPLRGLDGDLLLAYVVEADGTIRQVRVLENTGGPAEAWAATVVTQRQRFRPALKDGQAVPELIIAPMGFGSEPGVFRPF